MSDPSADVGMNHIDWVGGQAMLDAEPCTCAVAEDFPHTEAEHERDSCWGGSCGGCYDCVSRQARSYSGPGDQEFPT